MATVIGIFEISIINKKPLPVVKPGIKLEDLLILMTLLKCVYEAWKNNKCKFIIVFLIKIIFNFRSGKDV